MNTCAMAKISPGIHKKMENLKNVWDYKAGDVLLMSRWLWHRSLQTADEDATTVYQRYTVRYECGKSRVFSGDSFQRCVLYNNSYAGKTLDEVSSSSNLPFFPLAWPQTVDEFNQTQMEDFVKNILPDISAKSKTKMAELFTASKREK